MRGRLGSEMELQSVEDVSDRLQGLRQQPVDPRNAAFEARRAKLVTVQREERAALLKAQEGQRIADLKARQAQLPKRLRGLLARATGQYKATLKRFDEEAKTAARKDRAAQQQLVSKHLSERQALTRIGRSQGLSPAFHHKAQSDSEQALVLQDDSVPHSATQLTKSPELVIDHVSQLKASFKRVDVLRALAKRIDDPLTLQTAADKAMKSSQLVRLPNDGATPVFTTKNYKQAERKLDEAAQSMASARGFGVNASHTRNAITSQNAKMKRAFGGCLSKEQEAALHSVLGNKQLSSVVGLAGAGKSTLLATAQEAWIRQGIKVHGSALAGKAAEELEDASGIGSRTLASLELSWKNGYEPIAKGDVLVVDEAGMIGTRQLSRISTKMSEIGAKLVLVGDPDQLQPIEAGTPFRRLVKEHGAARLTEIHRQKSDWQKQASKELAAGKMSKAIEWYRKHGAVSKTNDRASAIEALVETYVMDVAAQGRKKSRLAFAHKRKDVHALNQAIRAALRADDHAPPETMFTTDTGKRAFAEKDRIVFTRNDKDIGVKNGMLGKVITADAGGLAVKLDGDKKRIVRFNPNDFRSFDHGYAVTIHKSQGATVDQSYVLASRSMDRHLAYVAMTRHRNDMWLFVNKKNRPIWVTEQHRHSQQLKYRSRDEPSMG
ncbi:MAG: AAA family ATPase [Sulfitobacter sp.]